MNIKLHKCTPQTKKTENTTIVTKWDMHDSSARESACGADCCACLCLCQRLLDHSCIHEHKCCVLPALVTHLLNPVLGIRSRSNMKFCYFQNSNGRTSSDVYGLPLRRALDYCAGFMHTNSTLYFTQSWTQIV